MASINLEEMLKQAINNPTKRSAFLQTLIRSNVFVMCRKPVKNPLPGEQVTIELITTTNPNGEVFIPFFTSIKALQIFAKRYVEYYEINCLKFFELVDSTSAVLNPNSYGKEFSAQEMKTILMVASHLNLKTIPMNQPSRISYEKPQYISTHIIKAASKYFAKHDNVEKAYIMDMMRDGYARPQILIIVDMVGSSRKLFLGLADATKRFLKYGLRYADGMYFINMEQDFTKEVIKNQIPFYTKKPKTTII